MADKIRDHNQYVFQKTKYEGLGNADTSREQFSATAQTDTLAAIALHESLLMYNSTATGTHPMLVRQALIKKAAAASKNS